MAQESDESGLKNLDPMRFWKYVLAKKRQHPCVVIYSYVPEKLCEWAKDYPQVNFVLQSDDIPSGQIILMPNVMYQWKSGMTYDEWLERWRWTDILLCDEKEQAYWLQAQLCGVEPVFDEMVLEKKLKDIKVAESPARIDNWESARNYLDTLKKL